MRGGRGRGGYNMPRDNHGWQNEDRQRYPGRDQYYNRPERGGRGIRGHDDNRRYSGPGQDWGSRGDRPYPERDNRRPPDGPRSPDRRDSRGKMPEKLKRYPGDGEWDDRKGPPLEEVVFDREVPIPKRDRDVPKSHARSSEDDWDYEEDVRQPELDRQHRKRPKEERPEELSPVPSKKSRKYVPPLSPDVPLSKPGDLEMKELIEAEVLKTPVEIPGEKTKRRKTKSEEKLRIIPVPVSDVITDTTVVAESSEVKPELDDKILKKHKKEKTKKVKGEKKKKKKSVEGVKTETAVEQELVTTATLPAQQGVVKVGKKRKLSEGGVVEEGVKGKKKKKKKHQPEVVVRPWSDLEGEDEQEAMLTKPTAEQNVKPDGQMSGILSTSKDNDDAGKQEEVFSDWSSDDNPEDFDGWEDEETPKNDVESTEGGSTLSASTGQDGPSTGQDGPNTGQDGTSLDDVYDPISDDELEQILEDGDTSASWDDKPAAVQVDWSVLAKPTSTDKGEVEPGSHLKKFTPAAIFSRIGISPALAGPDLLKRIQAQCTQESRTGTESNEETPLAKVESRFGGLVAAAEARKKERGSLVTNIGPCRRALCARQDLAMRKQLRKFSTKFGTKLSVFASAPTIPVENDLFQMSVTLYRQPWESATAEHKLLPSHVGSVLVST